jgi:hypothetical protein
LEAAKSILPGWLCIGFNRNGLVETLDDLPIIWFYYKNHLASEGPDSGGRWVVGFVEGSTTALKTSGFQPDKLGIRVATSGTHPGFLVIGRRKAIAAGADRPKNLRAQVDKITRAIKKAADESQDELQKARAARKAQPGGPKGPRKMEVFIIKILRLLEEEGLICLDSTGNPTHVLAEMRELYKSLDLASDNGTVRVAWASW